MATGGSLISLLSGGSSFLLGLKLMPYLKARVEQWERESKKIDILVTGKTGTGKSTLINGIVGKEVAKQGHSLNPETSIVHAHTVTEGEITVNVFDSPGLQDGTSNEAQYLADMSLKCSDVDLIVYCIRMSEDRVLVDGPDVRAMKRLNENFGNNMWKNTIFLLTFANDVVDDAELECDETEDQRLFFDKQLQEWESLLRERLILTVGVPKEIVDSIVITPAGHKNQPLLPDSGSIEGQSHWLSRVWLKALGSTKPKAQLALIKLNLHRIQTQADNYKNDGNIENELISQHFLVFQEKGAEIGKSLGISAGEMIGEVAGFLAGRESFIDSLVMQLLMKAGIISNIELDKIAIESKGNN